MDFGALPPEVNSGRLYAGPGAESLLVAASAWDSVAAELAAAASGCRSVIAELSSSVWAGPSSAAAASAVTPYASWLGAASESAEESAIHARLAAAAFEAARAGSVPPPVIAANRASLLTLISTNFFGQNTAPIMATEAQYLEMWAQDAAAMYGYAAASAAATVLSSYPSPPRTTTPEGLLEQQLAVAQAAAEPAGNAVQTVGAAATTQLNQLSSWLPTPAASWWNLTTDDYRTALAQIVPLVYAEGFVYIGSSIGQQTFNGIGTTAGAAGAWYPTPAFAGLHLGGISGAGAVSGTTGGPALVSAGVASKVGMLSVPSSWANSETEVALVSAVAEDSPAPVGAGAANGPGGPDGPGNTLLRGMPAGVPGRRAGGYGFTNKYGFKHSVLARPPSAG